MKRERVLCVSEYFEPHWTGLAKSFLSLARSFVEAGHEVAVLTVCFRSDLTLEETIYGMKVYRVPYLFQLSRTQYSPQSIFKFIQLVKNYDTVVINSPYSNILPISLLAKLFGKRLVIYHQGDLILASHCGLRFKNWLIEKIFDFCTIFSMALANRISTYTLDYATHSRVMKWFLNKFSPVIPPIRISSEGGKNSEIEKLILDIKKNNSLVGFAGRFVEEKGFDILFKAIPEIVKSHPNIRFVFAGETSVWYEKFYDHISYLTKNYSQYLVFLGLLNGSDLQTFYESLDLFVLCSRSDCFALTQAEAALKGVPIVVTDIPGARVLTRESGFGEVVAKENPSALAEGIKKVLDNKERYRSREPFVKQFLSRYQDVNLLFR